MIITRSPVRISLGGGGTDLPSYYSGHRGFLNVHRRFGDGFLKALLDLAIKIFADGTDREEITDLHQKRRCRSGRNSAKMASETPATTAAFTLIELIVVIAIIIVLASLILGTSTYVQMKGKRSRAEVEIAAMSAALESYKADNGIYPRDTANATTDNLDARTSGNPATYRPASLFLYTQLSGTNPDRSSIPGAKSYFIFPPNMLIPRDQSSSVTAIADPFGNSYGYSTAYQANQTTGYNPTFDLWSTGAAISNANPPDQAKWIKNW